MSCARAVFRPGQSSSCLSLVCPPHQKDPREGEGATRRLLISRALSTSHHMDSRTDGRGRSSRRGRETGRTKYRLTRRRRRRLKDLERRADMPTTALCHKSPRLCDGLSSVAHGDGDIVLAQAFHALPPINIAPVRRQKDTGRQE